MRDPDARLLATLSKQLEIEYSAPEHDPWKGSPFAWILSKPSRQKGSVGEKLLAGWCAMKDLNVERSPDSDADRIIEGHRVEIKLSTLWKNGGYKFQQIRDQDYEYLICLGICPFDAHGWIIKKTDIPFDEIAHQHGGAAGTDTWWLAFKPESPPAWLRKHGSGRLADVYQVLAGLKS